MENLDEKVSYTVRTSGKARLMLTKIAKHKKHTIGDMLEMIVEAEFDRLGLNLEEAPATTGKKKPRS